MRQRVQTFQRPPGTLLDGPHLRRLRVVFLRYVRALSIVDRRTWTFPGGGLERRVATYGFPRSRWGLLIAPVAWHYWSVLVTLSAGPGRREFFDGMNTPLAELYLPISRATWRPNFVACYGRRGSIEVRCFGRFRVGGRSRRPAAFFRYLRRVEPSLTVQRDSRGKEYISIGRFRPRASRKELDRFWRGILRLIRSVASYKRRRRIGVAN